MAIRLKPDFIDAYFQRAYAYYHKDDLTRAITEFGAVLRLAPDVSGGYIGRGSVYELTHRWTEAIADYNDADPPPAGQRNDLYPAWICPLQAGRKGGGDRGLQPGITARPRRRVLPSTIAGCAYRDEQRWDLSLLDFYAAGRMKPKDVRVMNGRGILYRDQGRYELAEAEFTKSLGLEPTNYPAFFGRGLSRFRRGTLWRRR